MRSGGRCMGIGIGSMLCSWWARHGLALPLFGRGEYLSYGFMIFMVGLLLIMLHLIRPNG